jgi:hypothetical protein
MEDHARLRQAHVVGRQRRRRLPKNARFLRGGNGCDSQDCGDENVGRLHVRVFPET